MAADKIAIELTGDEALMLFDWLVRFNDARAGVFEDQAEQRVLWDVECMLEQVLAEPFRKDYVELLRKARERVRDRV